MIFSVFLKHFEKISQQFVQITKIQMFSEEYVFIYIFIIFYQFLNDFSIFNIDMTFPTIFCGLYVKFYSIFINFLQLSE